MTHSSKVARSDARFRIRQWTCAIGFRLGVGPAESLGQREGITQPEIGKGSSISGGTLGRMFAGMLLAEIMGDLLATPRVEFASGAQ